MIRVHTYLESPLITLQRFDHQPGEAHVDPPEEHNLNDSIIFVDRGGYTIKVGRREWRMSPGTVYILRRRLVYRCGHAEDVPPDVSFGVVYDKSFSTSRAGRGPGPVTPLRVAPLTNRLAYLRVRLSRLAQSPGEVMAAPLALLREGAPGSQH